MLNRPKKHVFRYQGDILLGGRCLLTSLFVVGQLGCMCFYVMKWHLKKHQFSRQMKNKTCPPSSTQTCFFQKTITYHHQTQKKHKSRPFQKTIVQKPSNLRWKTPGDAGCSQLRTWSKLTSPLKLLTSRFLRSKEVPQRRQQVPPAPRSSCYSSQFCWGLADGHIMIAINYSCFFQAEWVVERIGKICLNSFCFVLIRIILL